MSYTVLGSDDENLRVTVTEGSEQTVITIQPAALTIVGAVTSVNGETGAVVVETGLSESEVDAKIDQLVDGAPGTLDTLNEIAAAINDDEQVYDTLTGLITANTTNIALKANLSDLSSVALSGDYTDLLNTPTIPDNNNQLTNGAGYITDYTVTEADVTQHQTALSITESQISDLVHYTDADVDAHLTGGVGVTYTTGDISIGQPVGITDDVNFNSVTARMYGASHITVKNAEGAIINQGDPVYFKGISGEEITVGVADANDPAKMPAFGIAATTANDNAALDIITHGQLTNIDTSAYATNDELYVSTTGTLTTTRPTGADDAIQKIARVERVHASAGILYVMGAGRSNDIPNLATGHVFIGNGGGYEKRALTSADITDLTHYTDADVDTHLNTSTATTDQVLTWSGSDYTWADASGGGASALGDLTDVNITSVADGDLIRYNGTAAEWQNTNLGLTVTPTYTLGSELYSTTDVTVTITNWGDYDDANIWAQVLDSTDTVVVSPSAITDNNDGSFTFTVPAADTGYKLQVRVQDFGDLASEINEQTFDSLALFGWSARYIRLADFTTNNDLYDLLYTNFRFYTGAGQTGTALPSNMTSSNAPAPFVVTASDAGYNSTYAPWTVFDSNLNSGWWTLGTSSAVADTWIQIDLGASYTINSMTLRTGSNSSDITNGFTIYTSDTGAFAGEEVQRETVSHPDSTNTTHNVN